MERFTAQARELVALAHEESRALSHDRIGCEHILLALVHAEKGLAARMFKSLGITVDRVRAQVVRSVVPGPGVTEEEILFTRQAKKALELSLHESLSLGDSSVISFHILLGLLREEENLRTRTLSLLEVDAEQLARAAEEESARAQAAVPSARVAHLAELARAQIEKQAALKARDFERVTWLDIGSSMTLSLMAEDSERRADPVVARVRTLLETGRGDSSRPKRGVRRRPR